MPVGSHYSRIVHDRCSGENVRIRIDRTAQCCRECLLQAFH